MCNFACMNVEEIREYCLNLEEVSESMPFDDETLVFKVCGKIFCFANLRGQLSINIKCDPVEALEMREVFTSVFPGFHMNKTHWNTVIIDGSISDGMIKVWIEKSYKLVISKLTRKDKALFK